MLEVVTWGQSVIRGCDVIRLNHDITISLQGILLTRTVYQLRKINYCHLISKIRSYHQPFSVPVLNRTFQSA